ATVQVTGTFGFTSIPVAIQQATLLLTLRQYRRYDSPLGVAGFDDMGVVRVGRIDPDVQKLIAPFRRVKMA
ncbi:MAG TPA: phage gp6-like head-tail connector protein, partial [Candidatus Paceibacterota bacterium]|nr:phage gp6-like head-tail connector protein [Candidatus Paceibacterota bacterium]